LVKIAWFFPWRGKKKPEVKLLFWENCMILKKFSELKALINGRYLRRKKSPAMSSNEGSLFPVIISNKLFFDQFISFHLEIVV
jgi:hypothetical protein